MTTLDTQNEEVSWLKWLIPCLGFAFMWWALPLLLPQMPLAWLATEQAAWFLTRASGAVAYLLLSFSTMWGLMLSTRLIKNNVPPAITLATHNYTSWAAIGFTIFHAVVLLFDSYYTYSWVHLLVPFTGPYSPFWVGLGILGLYLMVLTSVSFYFRKQMGQKNWRKLHYLTFVAYIFATSHGFMAGTDAASMGVMFLVSGAIVVFLTAYRILATVTAK